MADGHHLKNKKNCHISWWRKTDLWSTLSICRLKLSKISFLTASALEFREVVTMARRQTLQLLLLTLQCVEYLTRYSPVTSYVWDAKPQPLTFSAAVLDDDWATWRETRQTWDTFTGLTDTSVNYTHTQTAWQIGRHSTYRHTDTEADRHITSKPTLAMCQ